jgi:hypothetical protein
MISLAIKANAGSRHFFFDKWKRASYSMIYIKIIKPLYGLYENQGENNAKVYHPHLLTV